MEVSDPLPSVTYFVFNILVVLGDLDLGEMKILSQGLRIPSLKVLVSEASGRAIAQAVSCWLPTAAVRGSKPDLVMWNLWWDKVTLGQVFSEYFSFPCNRRSLHQLLHNHPHVSSGENVQ
jgi:hypothetical protein